MNLPTLNSFLGGLYIDISSINHFGVSFACFSSHCFFYETYFCITSQSFFSTCHLKIEKGTVYNRKLHLYTPTIDFRWYISFHWVFPASQSNVCRNSEVVTLLWSTINVQLIVGVANMPNCVWYMEVEVLVSLAFLRGEGMKVVRTCQIWVEGIKGLKAVWHLGFSWAMTCFLNEKGD